MQDLIEALQIFAKYTDARYPTSCRYEEFYVIVRKDGMAPEDVKRLDALGFFYDEGVQAFKSYRFGSN